MQSVHLKRNQSPPIKWSCLCSSCHLCYNGIHEYLDQIKTRALPTSPGWYIHKDKNGTIIHVGKAVPAIACAPISVGSQWYKTSTGVWNCRFPNLSSLSPILRHFQNQSHQGKSALLISCSRMISPIPSSKSPMSAILCLIITRQVKKDGGPILALSGCGRSQWNRWLLDRIFPFRKCTNPTSKVRFITILPMYGSHHL